MNTNRKYNFTILLVLLLGLSGLEPALAQDVYVNSANPDSAEQDTVNLDVTIVGERFGKSAWVSFVIPCDDDDDDCVPPFGGITVNSVKVRGSKKLIANIDIASDATVGEKVFDIEVEMLSGRKGKGTGRELFSVTPRCTPWPSCRMGEPGDGPNSHLYDVTISGDLSGGGMNWQQESGNSRVNFKDWFQDITGSLDLSYFRLRYENGGPFDGSRGENCFGGGDVPLFQAILDKSRGGSAEANFWFVGNTATIPSTQVMYRLRLFGVFDGLDDWPPSVSKTMIMTDWRMVVENEGKKIKTISCVGDGTFDPGEVTIYVVHMDP